MNRKTVYFLIVVLMLGLLGISFLKQKYHTLDYYITDYKSAKEMIQNEEVIIIDVRSNFEYQAGHIKDAINLPVTEIEKGNIQNIKNKNTYYLIYCNSGSRSLEATKKLSSLGYRHVYNFGSIENWEEPLVKGKN